jgi:membrane protein involved in colicin uptake
VDRTSAEAEDRTMQGTDYEKQRKHYRKRRRNAEAEDRTNAEAEDRTNAEAEDRTNAEAEDKTNAEAEDRTGCREHITRSRGNITNKRLFAESNEKEAAEIKRTEHEIQKVDLVGFQSVSSRKQFRSDPANIGFLITHS